VEANGQSGSRWSDHFYLLRTRKRKKEKVLCWRARARPRPLIRQLIRERRRMADQEDPVERMLKATGCIQLHYKVQECIAETKDWRKCQKEVHEFRTCMSKHQKAKDTTSQWPLGMKKTPDNMYCLYGLLTGFTLGVLTALAWKSSFFKSMSSVAKMAVTKKGKYSKMVIVVRTELGMTKGKIAAQCSHAALGCYKIAQKTTPELVKSWEDFGQPKIVLKLDTAGEEGLYALTQEAKKRGVASTVIRDAGHTQVERGTATVAGFGPADEKVIDQITGHLKLL